MPTQESGDVPGSTGTNLETPNFYSSVAWHFFFGFDGPSTRTRSYAQIAAAQHERYDLGIGR